MKFIQSSTRVTRRERPQRIRKYPTAAGCALLIDNQREDPQYRTRPYRLLPAAPERDEASKQASDPV